MPHGIPVKLKNLDVFWRHYWDVIMSAIASQITSLTIVYSTVYSGTDQRKHQSSSSLAFCARNSPGTGEFPAQKASNAGNVFIWWCNHGNRRPFHWWFFICYLKSMQNSSLCNSTAEYHTTFVSCNNINDQFVTMYKKAKQRFHQIWITSEISLVQGLPGVVIHEIWDMICHLFKQK